MTLKIYDTLKRKTVGFTPHKVGEVSIYACGPTVYDVPHLGHARTAITYDVIARYLEWRGNKVRLVSNVTDIDDKIIARAASEGSTESELAEKYLHIYNQQMAMLNVRPPTRQPRAIEYIKDPSKSQVGMISIIAELVKSGAAYVVKGNGVYFDISKEAEYGKLVGRSLKDLKESAQERIEKDTAKRHPLDFALWKAAKPGEPEWKSPWMSGRPGWHTECVAMSLSELGDDFDIHGGGSDLIFPHHENERAQACAMGKKFARYWIHSGMVNIAGEKMAKSENTFIDLSTQLETTGVATFRLALLQTHYRSILELDEATLEAADSGVKRVRELMRKVVEPDPEPTTEDLEPFIAAMDMDFGTPTALGVMFNLVREANKALEASDEKLAKSYAAAIVSIDHTLGLGICIEPSAALDNPKVKELMTARSAARQAGNYQKSDELRDALLELGVKSQDHPDKPTDYIPC